MILTLLCPDEGSLVSFWFLIHPWVITNVPPQVRTGLDGEGHLTWHFPQRGAHSVPAEVRCWKCMEWAGWLAMELLEHRKIWIHLLEAKPTLLTDLIAHALWYVARLAQGCFTNKATCPAAMILETFCHNSVNYWQEKWCLICLFLGTVHNLCKHAFQSKTAKGCNESQCNIRLTVHNRAPARLSGSMLANESKVVT